MKEHDLASKSDAPLGDELLDAYTFHRAIEDAICVGVAAVDLSGRQIYVNRSFCRMTGYAAEDLLNKQPPFAYWPKEEVGRITDALEKTLSGEGGPGFELTFRRKNGEPFDALVLPSELRTADGTLAGYVASIADITQQKKTQTELQQRIEELRGVYELSVAVIRADGLNDVMERALDGLLENTGCHRCAVLLYDAEGVMRFSAWRGLEDSYLKLAEGHSPWPRDAVDPQPVLVPDVAKDAGLRDLASKIKEHGISALGFIPLVYEKRLLGKLMIYFDEPHEFTDLEVKTAQTIANHVAFAIEKKKSEQRLRLYEQIIANSSDGIAIIDTKGEYLEQNRAHEQLLGFTAEDLTGKTPAIHLGDDTFMKVAAELMEKGEYRGEATSRSKSGDLRIIDLAAFTVRDEKGEPACFVGIKRDVTQRKLLEEQLLHSQKLEGIGKLAGGIAHDFNNLITALLGYTEITRAALPPGDPLRRNIQQIEDIAARAADLVRQLLAFARKQIIEPKIVNLNDLVSNTHNMLRRLIGENIDLELDLQRNLWNVLVDPSQFDQILVNLSINARDAMPRGGGLCIRTRNTTLKEATADLLAGECVVVTVSDTGAGMPPDVLSKIFEPFYTTKETGKGTGLGLSTCYGTVKQFGGHISAESAVGTGSTFTIWLPRAVADEAGANESADETDKTRTATVLILEDEPLLLEIARETLETEGYKVLIAQTGLEALKMSEAADNKIDLLIADVVMPDISGREAADAIQKKHPSCKVLFVSGYTEDSIVHHGVLEDGVRFLPKPYTPKQLARKIREVLGAT